MSSKELKKRADSDSDLDDSDGDSAQSLDQDKVQEFDWRDLPPHACNYCGIHEVNSVVKCTAKNCGKWFCNSKGSVSLNQETEVEWLVTSSSIW